MINDIFTSINTYLQALKLINTLKLWKYFLIPAFLGFVIGSILISIAFSLSDNLGNWITGFWKWEFGKSAISTIGTWFGGFVILLFGIIIYRHLLMAVSAPFMTPVSEKVEAYLTKKPLIKSSGKSEFITQLVRSLRINSRNLLKELLITLPLMVLSLIPVIGLLAVVFIFYYQSYYTGFGNMDYTLERHLNYQDSKRFVKKHKGIAVGNGAVFTLMLFIPFIGIILTLPIATVASTIDTVKKLELV